VNIVDSSGWLEYFADGKNASFFEQAIIKVADLLVPTISLYEVFKKIYQERGESEALLAIALMQQGSVIDLDSAVSLSAARISAEIKPPMPDSIILATARTTGATLWTQDADFDGIQGMRYIQAD
jgi:predicted nucleic acid-binding protein